MKHIFLLVLQWMTVTTISAQDRMPLYDGVIPGSKPAANNEKTEITDGKSIVSQISRPELIIYPATKKNRTGTAVIIFPGGGYWVNAISHEGTDVAERLAASGITSFVVKYRIPDSLTMENPAIGPFQDAQRAMILVHSLAGKYDIDASRIGIMGFSAGGHLASTLATRFDEPLFPDVKPSVLRPAFAALIYPVISSDTAIAHQGSFAKLLGANPSQSLLDSFSNEKNITAATPPVFLMHAKDDDVVSYLNSVRFYEAIQKFNSKSSLLLVPAGGHGFGMNNPTTKEQWIEKFLKWISLLRANAQR